MASVATEKSEGRCCTCWFGSRPFQGREVQGGGFHLSQGGRFGSQASGHSTQSRVGRVQARELSSRDIAFSLSPSSKLEGSAGPRASGPQLLRCRAVRRGCEASCSCLLSGPVERRASQRPRTKLPFRKKIRLRAQRIHMDLTAYWRFGRSPHSFGRSS